MNNMMVSPSARTFTFVCKRHLSFLHCKTQLETWSLRRRAPESRGVRQDAKVIRQIREPAKADREPDRQVGRVKIDARPHS